MMSTVRLLTINEATVVARVSRRTIYNWLRAGRLSYRRTAGGSVRIDEDSLFRASPHTLPPFPVGPLLDPTELERLVRRS